MSAAPRSLFSTRFVKPLLDRVLIRQAHSPRVKADFDHLLNRIRGRRYPKGLQTLAFYWLRTVVANGYDLQERRELCRLLSPIPPLDSARSQIATDLQNWVRQMTYPAPEAQQQAPPRLERVTSHLNPEMLAPYICRLLNEWLPREIARLLVDEPGMSVETLSMEPADIPASVTARAIERLLVREHLSAATLEALLSPGLLSPRFAYPGDVELLRDVVLFLLRRTEAPEPAVLPATLLRVSADSPIANGHAEAVERAFLAQGTEPDELYVPVAREQAFQLLRRDRLRIRSIVVTMDGRWWHADRLVDDGEEHLIAYCPG